MEVLVRSLPLHYEEHGTGVPVLMLHGWPADHRHMVMDMEPLFQHRTGWRRIYPDLPGMGKTPSAAWITHQDHMLDVVEAFLDEVAADQRFVVVGTSYGGYLARGLVHRRAATIDGICLIVPDIEPDPTKRNYPPHEVLGEDPRFLEALTPEESNLGGLFVVQSLEALTAFRTVIQPAIALADHAFLERLDRNYAFSFPVDEVTIPVPAPTLILAGRQDSVCGYREGYAILDKYPRGTFAVLDRAGHGLGLEQTGLFRALTQEWLDRVEEYRSGSGA